MKSIIDELLEKATKGCCRNESWRQHLCLYHEGFLDGMEAYGDALGTWTVPELNDGVACGERPNDAS